MVDAMTGFNSKRAAAADKNALFEKFELAQPAQEPVAWIWKDMRGQDVVSLFEPRFNSIPLYTTPPKREWVGLTQKEVQEIHDTYHKRIGPQEFASMIGAKLKEKNND